MTPMEAVAVALASSSLLIFWRLIEGWLTVQRRKVKADGVSKAFAERLSKLELEFTRLPMDVPDVRDLEALSEELSEARRYAESLEVKLQNTATIAQAELAELERKLITREIAEKIVNQVNAVTLEVEALKEWQSTLESTGELAQTLGLEPKEN